MTSKFTSRFRRGSPTDAASPADTTKAEAALPPNDAKLDAATPEPAKDAAQPEQPVVAAASVADEKVAQDTVAKPSRLIEMEKPKAAEPERFAQAKAWLSNAHAYRVPAAAAVALVLAMGTGYGFGAAGQTRDAVAAAKSAKLLEGTARDLRDAHGQIGQLTAELRSLKASVESMKGDREKSRGDILGKQAQLFDRVEKAGQENATRIGRLAEQLDRIEKTQRDANRQAASDKGAADKADKPEKVAVAPTPPAKPHLDVAHTGSIGDAKGEKIDPRKTVLEGYIVRDYDDGFALIETRSGRYIDVAVGYNLPGIGRVEAIERRGRQWVVITPKGYIGER